MKEKRIFNMFLCFSIGKLCLGNQLKALGKIFPVETNLFKMPRIKGSGIKLIGSKTHMIFV